MDTLHLFSFLHTWQDLGSKTKKKKSEQIKHATDTRGGHPLLPKLDITDELILSNQSHYR